MVRPARSATACMLFVAGCSLIAVCASPSAPSLSHAQTATLTFPQTGKSLGGTFLEYWQDNGEVPLLGYPISEEMQERSDTDGKLYAVQYFERAVLEHHPENAAPFDVLP